MDIPEPIWRVEVFRRLDAVVSRNPADREAQAFRQLLEVTLCDHFDLLVQAIAAENLDHVRAVLARYYPGSLLRGAKIVAALRGEETP